MLPTGGWKVGRAEDTVSPVLRLPESIAAPALYDAHVHLHPQVRLTDYVRHGIGRIRDLGSTVGADQAVPTGRCCAEPVPDIVLGGPLLDRPGKQRLPFAAPWRDAAELPNLVDAAAERGAAWLKLYDRFPGELVEPAVRLAHDRGLRVTLHPPPGEYRAALDAGVDELQHLACLTPRGDGSRGTRAVLRHWAGRDHGDAWPDLPRGTAICPTLLVQHQLVREAESDWTFPDHAPGWAALWRQLPTAARPWGATQLITARQAVARLSAAIGELDHAGVRWVIGSDTPNPGVRPGRSLWEEMNLLVSAGLGPLRIYRSAAVAPAVAEAGEHPLTFLPRGAFDSGRFSTEPPTATLLHGCLFRPNP